MNRWLLYYKEQAAYKTKKSELLDSSLLVVQVENNQGTVQLDNSAKSETPSALYVFAKPVMRNCAICRTPASSTGGILHENWVNHEVYAENFKQLSEEEQKAC